ncbi:winged helix-turn-helix transcriptional regulator [Pseudoduganella armeniaca]|uniref:Transcriptional regulator n=1 Tax=Pseudoduganella armeniaca TaxID=2072590 RepID=A0A2R4CAX4_9BURK|nr:helix-turn-helix domain-containing protein [Pseudoduganella armeniaca]AVR96779.1 transcriptional regulator [Pseudoduganella armeniaca]
MPDARNYFCSIEVALDCISGKWKPAIVYRLKGGALRFTELHRQVPQASRKVLTEQLRQLEADGLVVRIALDDEVPRGVCYDLTAVAQGLLPALRLLHDWGIAHAQRQHLHLRLLDERADNEDAP